MTRSIRQIALWLVVGATLLPSFAGPVYAQGVGNEWVANSVETFVNIIGTPDIEKESFDTASLSNSMLALACFILGCTSDATNPFGYNKSAVAGLSNMAVAMYEEQPANTLAFVQDLSQTLGFSARPAYAQGVGFTGLSALLPLWKQFRNIAYALVAIVMIVVAFMVMLRKKIDPKTVVTVQNAIPNIVVALILITFSYAIVGLLIDFMYVVMAVFIQLIINAGGQEVFGPQEFLGVEYKGITTTQEFLRGGFWVGLRGFFWGGFSSINNLLSLIPWYASAGAVAIPGILGFVLSGLSIKAGLLGLTAAPGLFLVMIALILIIGFVRLLFMLVDAYIHIIIALLIAPLQLAMVAIPGTDAFGSWFKNLVSKLIVFPITGILILITWILTSYGSQDKLWAPPLVLADGASAGGLSGIIGLGMLLSIPNIVAGIQKMFKAEPVVPGGITTIAGPVGTAAGQLINLAYQFSFISSAFRHGKQPPTPYATSIGAGTQGLSGIVKGGGGGGSGGH